MCGFVGFWGGHEIDRQSVLARMSREIAHRGPDDNGSWFDENSSFCFTHRRLAIQDLSEAGCQPMKSLDGRFVLVFNGEIYNHLKLRGELRNSGWSAGWDGTSDTETLLAAIQVWGAVNTLPRLVGMFSFALWDTKKKKIFLARDRVGEKPLYYGAQGGTFLFGSELKALTFHPHVRPVVDRRSLSVFLRHNYIPSPNCIYQNFRKLPPGCYIELGMRDGPLTTVPDVYWSVNECVGRGLETPFRGSDTEAMSALNDALRLSVGSQMISDVPIGAFLSGGIDSSLVAALMQEQSSSAISTFSVGFDDPAFDEATHAKAVASHLGTNHTDIYLSGKDSLDVVPKLPRIFCEPFADSSQIPMYLVSEMARKSVTVALSGDGGDELFGGYSSYQFAPRYWRAMNKAPQVIRSLLADMIKHLPVSDRVSKLASVMPAGNREDFYRRLVSHWQNPDSVVIDGNEHGTLLSDVNAWPDAGNYESWMMAMESQMYMADDILVKLDRAAMVNSLETRVPLLDHRVIELAWSFPLKMKIRDGQGKWILRQVLNKYVPQELIDRPKKGFSVPLAAWLRGPLREWAEALLSERLLRDQGYFNVQIVRDTFNQHLCGHRDNSLRLWSVLMFQAWLENQHA